MDQNWTGIIAIDDVAISDNACLGVSGSVDFEAGLGAWNNGNSPDLGEWVIEQATNGRLDMDHTLSTDQGILDPHDGSKSRLACLMLIENIIIFDRALLKRKCEERLDRFTRSRVDSGGEILLPVLVPHFRL